MPTDWVFCRKLFLREIFSPDYASILLAQVASSIREVLLLTAVNEVKREQLGEFHCLKLTKHHQLWTAPEEAANRGTRQNRTKARQGSPIRSVYRPPLPSPGLTCCLPQARPGRPAPNRSSVGPAHPPLELTPCRKKLKPLLEPSVFFRCDPPRTEPGLFYHDPEPSGAAQRPLCSPSHAPSRLSTTSAFVVVVFVVSSRLDIP